MWFFNRSERACCAFEAHLEDYLEALESGPGAQPHAALAGHLAACSACREALEQARHTATLVRQNAIPVPDALTGDPFFAARVAARIRENAGRSGEFWPQLESVSLRLMAYALSLAVLLGALSASGVTRMGQQASARLRPSDPRTISPELNPAPVNTDEVVVALLSSERGRQR